MTPRAGRKFTPAESGPTIRRMTVADPPPQEQTEFDPDEYRMSIGEHLEELRWRIILSLIGMVIAIFGCMAIGERVIEWFCIPLTRELLKHRLNPQVVYTGLSEPFMTYLKVVLIVAASVSAPWMLYQLWQFVAAGLYPKERKMITRYIPLSITLLLTGFVFVYVLVLPLSIDFFLEFSSAIPLPASVGTSPKIATTQPLTQITTLGGDPVSSHNGELWYNEVEGRLKIRLKNGDRDETRILAFNAENLASPMITLGDYIDLAITFMLTFGVSFQLPLVLMALVGVGLVDVDFLKQKRRIVYFVLTIVAAVMAPGDIVTSMMALLVPLVILYEFGIWLAQWSARRKAREA